MDNSNKRNLLYRLTHLSIKNRSTTSTAAKDLNNGKITNCNNNISSNNNNKRKSFRKSLKKMHTRVKTTLCRQKTDQNAVTTLSSIQEQSQLEIQPEQSNIVGISSSICSSLRRTRAVPTDEISNCSWYWGPLTIEKAEEKLQHESDGAFLIRDSSSDSYLFTISFRSVGRTMHSRIEYSRGQFSLYGQEGFETITELIENAVRISQDDIYCYSRTHDYQPNYPVRLYKPISRYSKELTLKHLCRFVIRQYTNINDIPRLPLPPVLCNYLCQGQYF